MGRPGGRGRFCELCPGDNAALDRVQSRAEGAHSSEMLILFHFPWNRNSRRGWQAPCLETTSQTKNKTKQNKQ